MKKYSQKTITRTLLYIRTLKELIRGGVSAISSKKLAEITGLTDVQIRKDISQFGKVGKPRIGYSTAGLTQKLENVILQDAVEVALFGVGNLGSAILRYPGFHQERMKIVAAFDNTPNKVGKKINGVPVFHVRDAARVLVRKRIRIGILAVPKEVSQQAANVMLKAGVKGIVNFTPVSIAVPQDVSVKNIDLTIEFLSLFHDVMRKRQRSR